MKPTGEAARQRGSSASFDVSRLPDRTRRFIEHGAPEGERQKGAFDAACQLRDAGATEAEAVALVEQGAARCGLQLLEAQAAVKSAFKRTPREPIHKANDGTPTKHTISATYDYTDESGRVLFQCVRFTPKDFRQRQPGDKGGWTWNLKDVRLVIYRLPEVSKATGDVFVVEGEKDCDTLAALGFTATTNPLGAEKWREEYNEALRGKSVVIVPDNDAPGRRHGEQVGRSLHGIAANVRVVRLPNTVKDVTEFVATFTDKADAAERLAQMVEGAAEWTPTQRAAETPADAAPTPLSAAIVTSAELAALAVEPRRFIVKPFFREGDLGFVYAKRGDGKTWLAMLLAKAAATGGTAGPWNAEGVWPVLYVDGEMPAEESKRRDSVLSGASENLAWLHHEIFFDRTGKTLNLTSAATQAELTTLLLERGFRVLVLDNLSCLFSGMKENDADAWELVLPWLLELRRRKIAVVIVAHAGRNGQMRGTSRREDAAFWVLKLERQDSDDPLFRGLRFTSLFTKNRNALEDDCPPLEWTVAADGDGPATMTAKTISGVELLVSWVRAGLDGATDIAAEMGISKGQVSKLAKRAERLGLLVIEGRHYRPTVDK
jgi:5S rRNA maturation endonuclease (ribonuclease M5)